MHSLLKYVIACSIIGYMLKFSAKRYFDLFKAFDHINNCIDCHCEESKTHTYSYVNKNKHGQTEIDINRQTAKKT